MLWRCSRWFRTHTNSTDKPNRFHIEISYIDICITILFRSEWSVKGTDGQPGSRGSGPTNFIPAAGYSECITIPLSRSYLTLWMCHVHRDASFRISLMQHSQTSVEPHDHLKKKKKKKVMQALLLTVKFLQQPASVKANATEAVKQSVAKNGQGQLECPCMSDKVLESDLNVMKKYLRLISMQ